MEKLFSKKVMIAVLLLAVIGGLAFYYLNRKTTSREIRHVVFISIDTCRADYLSCYGFDKKTTPNIDHFAAEGILFENTYSPVPMTLPAHSSMLTGTIPPYHGVHDNFDYQLSPSNITLAEILKDNGFTTGAVISAFVLDSMFGINQGFEFYYDQFEDTASSGIYEERKAEETNRIAVDWLQKHRDEENFFLFLHYYDPHHEYKPPEPFASKFPDNLYAGEIAYTDHCIGRVLKKLKELKLYDSTLIIIAGDHGEMLNEHGEEGHQYFIYQSSVKVPMIFRLPGAHKPKRIKEPAGLVDIVPTICALLDITPPKQIQGQNLSAAIFEGQTVQKDRYIFCESLTPTKYFANPLLGLAGRQWKYIQNTRPELYNLTDDPAESNDLIGQKQQLARILKTRLDEVLMRSVSQSGDDSKITLDAEALQRLKSLGYVGGSVEESFDIDRSKDDARDTLKFYQIHHNISIFILNENYSQAETLCNKIIKEHPEFAFPYESLAQIAMKQQDPLRAIEYLSKLLELEKDNAGAHYYIGDALVAQDLFKEAVDHYREAIAIKPYDAKTYHKLGLALQSLDKPDEAIEQFRKAIELKPDEADYHYGLGEALQLQGNFAEASKCYQRTLNIEPDHAETHNNIGLLFQNQGNIQKALEHYQIALKSQEDLAEAHSNLGQLLQALGKPQEAVPHYRRALEINPAYAEVHYNLGTLLHSQDRIDDAMVHYRKALETKPNDISTHNNLGLALQSKGQIAEAIEHYELVLKSDPDYVNALISLAAILATNPDSKYQDGPRAVKLSQKACQLTAYKQHAFLDTLAAAYAAAGNFTQAVSTAQKAFDLAMASNQKQLAQQIEKKLQLYKADKPYRQNRPGQ